VGGHQIRGSDKSRRPPPHMMEKNALHNLIEELDQVGANFLVIWLMATLLTLIVVGIVAFAAI
jgi:hypothetical protein